MSEFFEIWWLAGSDEVELSNIAWYFFSLEKEREFGEYYIAEQRLC